MIVAADSFQESAEMDFSKPMIGTSVHIFSPLWTFPERLILQFQTHQPAFAHQGMCLQGVCYAIATNQNCSLTNSLTWGLGKITLGGIADKRTAHLTSMMGLR